MAFGFKSDPSRRYAYRVSAIDKADEQVLMQQLRLAHQFQCELVKIELDRRAASNAAVAAISPELEGLELKVAELETQYEEGAAKLSAARAAARDKKAGKEIAAELKAISKQQSATYKLVKEAKAKAYADPAAKEGVAAASTAAYERSETARKAAVAAGLYWATSLDVAQRVKKTGRPPRYPRFDGDGQLSIQFQRVAASGSEKETVLDARGNPRLKNGKPMTRAIEAEPMGYAQLLAGTTLMKISPLPAVRGNPESGPSEKWMSVDWRCGSGPKGRPVFAKLKRIAMHRPLPPGGTVKWAHLVRRKYGTQARWEIQFVVAMPEWPTKPLADSGTVGVALGWRKIGDELRVGHWVGSDGASGDIVIPERAFGRWKKADELQSLRAKQFNAMKDRLKAFLEGTAEFAERPEGFEIPEWLAVEASHLAVWKTPIRFVRLLRMWRDNRFPGDERYFAELEGAKVVCDDGKTRWTANSVAQDGHLYDWQAFSLRKARRWRKNHYLDLAATLARRYRKVVVGEIDWGEIGKTPAPESDKEDINRTNRGIAAVAALRGMLEQRMEPVRVSAEETAVTCHVCGTVGEKAPDSDRWVVCEHCNGEKRDRIVNGAHNLLKRGLDEQA